MLELPDLASVRALCIGDLMLDRFVEGTVKRISPESPVPIIEMGSTHSVPGGAANVARNIATLGGHCTLVGAIGCDAAGQELRALLAHSERIEPLLIEDAARPTIEKVRFVAHGQHLLRADREETGDVPAAVAQAMLAALEARVHDHDVLILSDYAKGILTREVVAGAIALAVRAGLPVVVDPKSADLARYAGATVITPNVREASEATGLAIHSDAEAVAAGARALAASGAAAVLMTRSERGMTLVAGDGQHLHMTASAREVFDVVGAGDTVVAALALCLGAGTGIETAARIANAAAGIVVGKRGTATVTRSELADEMARLSRVGLSPSGRKVMSDGPAAALREAWGRDGLKVGFTNGCFDILHVGHVALLEFARAQCDRLIVGVNRDASVSRLKGPSRPINNETDRARILGAFGFVDAVVLFGEDTPYELIRLLEPDVLVKGADYRVEDIVGGDIVEARGGTVVTFELIPGRSTTETIARAALAPEPAA